ncbi:MAG: hypothetical protein WC080_02045 [Patescibacteria group bacterium]|jgi:H+/gluconate symporter-like permease
MGKKKNKKLKKKQHGNTAPQIITHPSTTPLAPTTEIDVTPEIEEKVEKEEVKEEKKNDGYDDPAYKDEKKIVVKILLTILLMVVILIVAYYVNQKTTILSSFGDWVYKLLNIQTQ